MRKQKFSPLNNFSSEFCPYPPSLSIRETLIAGAWRSRLFLKSPLTITRRVRLAAALALPLHVHSIEAARVECRVRSTQLIVSVGSRVLESRMHNVTKAFVSLRGYCTLLASLRTLNVLCLLLLFLLFSHQFISFTFPLSLSLSLSLILQRFRLKLHRDSWHSICQRNSWLNSLQILIRDFRSRIQKNTHVRIVTTKPRRKRRKKNWSAKRDRGEPCSKEEFPLRHAPAAYFSSEGKDTSKENYWDNWEKKVWEKERQRVKRISEGERGKSLGDATWESRDALGSLVNVSYTRWIDAWLATETRQCCYWWCTSFRVTFLHINSTTTDLQEKKINPQFFSLHS